MIQRWFTIRQGCLVSAEEEKGRIEEGGKIFYLVDATRDVIVPPFHGFLAEIFVHASLERKRREEGHFRVKGLARNREGIPTKETEWLITRETGFKDFPSRVHGIWILNLHPFLFSFFFFPPPKEETLPRPLCFVPFPSKDTILYGNSRDTFFPPRHCFFFHDWKIIPSFLSLPLNLISQLKISANRGWLAIIPISKRDRVSRWTKAILTSSSPSSFLANFSFPQKQRNIPLFLSPLPLYFCLSINSLLSLTHSLLEQEGRCSLKNF